ncbi:hypothetical protein [Oceanobacter mangrovi]|uniref:hypothetical protein n=1 Tax=Oceanobacter mangrovi TaxID=2862510 RepID=UPI001C8D5434|nr:hypothetical protein [Oceanobacter mangrovi]
MGLLNQVLGTKMMDAAACLSELDALDVMVLSVDLDTAIPVLRVQPAKGLHRLTGAWKRSRRVEGGQLKELYRGNLAKCFVEWEVRP